MQALRLDPELKDAELLARDTDSIARDYQTWSAEELKRRANAEKKKKAEAEKKLKAEEEKKIEEEREKAKEEAEAEGKQYVDPHPESNETNATAMDRRRMRDWDEERKISTATICEGHYFRLNMSSYKTRQRRCSFPVLKNNQTLCEKLRGCHWNAIQAVENSSGSWAESFDEESSGDCVAKEVTVSDVKRSYRRLAMVWHPDKKHRPKAKARAESVFPVIVASYEIMSDERQIQLCNSGDAKKTGSKQQQQQQQRQIQGGSGGGGTGQNCTWAYVDCGDKSSEPLQLLEIRRSRLTPDAAECMGWAIQTNPTLRSVFLQFTTISGSLAKGLSVAQHLQSFVLSNADIGTEGGSAIGIVCGSHGCKKLQLERSKLSEGGCVAMAHNLRGSRSLEELRIVGCLLGSVGSAGAVGVIESIGTCSGLQTLFLIDASLGDAGALGLAKGLTENQEGMPVLETLLLQNNGIGDDGAAALANVMQQRCMSLKTLRLDNNAIESAGVEALCHGLARARVGGTLSIERVFLEGNSLDAEARAEWLGCCEALGVATDVALLAPEGAAA